MRQIAWGLAHLAMGALLAITIAAIRLEEWLTVTVVVLALTVMLLSFLGNADKDDDR